METLTPNAQATSAPVSSTPETTPKPESKAKRQRKRTAQAVSDAVRMAVAKWQHGIAPEGLHKASIVHRLGAKTGKVNKLNQPMVYKSMAVITPTVAALMRDDPALTKAQAEAKVREIGQQNKPLAMARVQMAASSPDYIVRRYTETPHDKGRHKLSVALERVNTEDWLERTARELGKTVAEVRKLLKLPNPAVTLEA